MPKAFASQLIDAPVDRVWAVVRDFNGLPHWNPSISGSVIEDGLAPDLVGCIRSLRLADGSPDGALGRERLLSLDDSNYSLAYNFETPPLPVFNYTGIIELKPVTATNQTLAIWRSTFDEAPEDSGRFSEILSKDVFAVGLRALADRVADPSSNASIAPPVLQLHTVTHYSAVLDAPLSLAWQTTRKFAISASTNDTPRDGRVGESRQLRLNEEIVREHLVALSDIDHQLTAALTSERDTLPSTRVDVRLFPITSHDKTLIVWAIGALAPTNVESNSKKQLALLEASTQVLKNIVKSIK
jgi:hypothetical protein